MADRLGNCVNLQRLSSQLKSEAKAHPAKAGMLAIGLALAVWFWVPLITKMFGGEEAPSAVAAKSPAAGGVNRSSLSVSKNPFNQSSAKKDRDANAASAGSSVAWPRLVEWIERDQRMETAVANDDVLDPFRPLVRPKVTIAGEQQQAEAIVRQHAVSPQSVGLELSSTLVGRVRSVAMINGKAYRLTRTESGIQQEPPFIKVQGNDREIRFLLTEVHAKAVVLENAGQEFRLKLPGQVASDAITISAVPSRN